MTAVIRFNSARVTIAKYLYRRGLQLLNRLLAAGNRTESREQIDLMYRNVAS